MVSLNLRSQLRCVVLFALLLGGYAQALAFQPDAELTARAALLMDAKTGAILYQKEADLRLPPASTTKVLTAIVVLENSRNLNRSFTVSKAATRVPASKLYLRPGQTATIEDLLYGILLASANDASNVLAEGVSGTVDRFAQTMTAKAHAIGATNSHFTNPHGLTAPDHYSTVKDLAVIFRYAMNNAKFRQIVQTKISYLNSTTVVRRKVVPRRISLRNHNRLLWNFDGAIGGKTGYTHAAQKCFVGAVERDGRTIIVAILGAQDMWGDTRNLLEYGFENFQQLQARPHTAARMVRYESDTLKVEPVAAVSQAAIEEPRAMDGYVLQVGSFREPERAETLSQQFRTKGFEAFVEKTTLNRGETTFRVRVGPYGELLEAIDMAQEILQKSGYQAIILPVSSWLRDRSDNG